MAAGTKARSGRQSVARGPGFVRQAVGGMAQPIRPVKEGYPRIP